MPVQGPEQDRGGPIVVVDVARDVGEVHTEPHPGGLVADRIHSLGGRHGEVGIGQIAEAVLGRLVQIGREPDVGVRVQGVDDAHLRPGLDEVVDHVRADEAGATRDEDPHAPSESAAAQESPLSPA